MPSSSAKPVLAVLALLIGLAYPLLVYLSLGHLPPHGMALVLLLLASARFAVARRDRNARWQALALGVLALLVFWHGNPLLLRYYPVLVNAAMLAIFGSSLIWPPSAIEQLARITEPDLPPDGVRYTRRVTQVWCGFFVLNGSIALATALWASWATWTLYNGLIAYLLMGGLFAIEWVLRQSIRKKKQ